MTVFQGCQKIEKEGVKMIAPLLKYWAGKGLLFDNTSAPPETQRRDGDFLIIKNGRRIKIELKTELENKHGNFFFETASNLGQREGWVWTCEADGLLYLFLKSKELYSIPWPKCKKWLRENAVNYPRAEQSKHKQQNKTVGRLVPIQHLVRLGLAKREKL
jgi:hypothetical protein